MTFSRQRDLDRSGLATFLIRTTTCLALITAGLAADAQRAEAQYFGRNKVQYEDFDFNVLETPHFRVYFYPAERRAVDLATRMAERWYGRFSPLLDYEFEDRQPLILYASHPHFRQTNVISGLIGQGTGGVTEPLKRRIVMPFAGPLAETDHVLGHELVHGFQFGMRGSGLGNLPLWFVEGMAEYLSLGPRDPHTAMWIRDALAHDRLPSIEQLRDPDYFPYRFGHAFFAYMAGVYGDSIVPHLLRRSGQGIRASLVGVTGMPLDTLSRRWHEVIRAHYGPFRDVTQPPERFGRRVISDSNAGEVNVGPALSPDGSKIAFLSEKSLFGIELFVADVETGEIERQLTEATLDPHFNNLEFIRSAGAWHPDGRSFAFAGVSGGQPILTVVDVVSGEVRRERKFPKLGQIFNPAWSPDGRSIAFSALVDGTLDLYIYDPEGDSLRRLTDDVFAELQPAWSPDGTRLAFATDRFTTDLNRLGLGGYRLAVLRVADASIRTLDGLPDGKHLNPQWSPDGESLYFVSDWNGVSNVYRTELTSGRTLQLTNLFTGVSGITAQSPALSVSADSGTLAFSVFRDGKYAIYLADEPRMLAGFEPRAPEGPDPALLPPAVTERPERLAWLDDPRVGLPPDTTYVAQDYDPSLSLDYIAQPTVVAGADQFGSFFGGGTAVFFSDMLARHRLGTMLQINGSFENLAAAVAYQNYDNRLVWGGGAQRIPVFFSTFAVGTDTIDGQPAIVNQEILFRETTYRVMGTAWYPFSEVLRLEFAAGYRGITFEQEIRTVAFGPGGQVLLDEERETSPFDALHLANASAALVYDNTFFGATSPIVGQRFRLESTPVLGSLNYVEALGDYRRYLMPLRPFTFAFRILHFGRYGEDSEDERVRNLFVGAPGLVRGYNRGSFDVSECEPVPGDPCPIFNQLLGSRIAVANAEIRFPILGILGFGEGYYGAFPLEMAFFADAGMAWRQDIEDTPIDEQAFFFGGDREPVYSAGVTLRFNLNGFIVLQYDLARAFERDEWVSQFGFLPGF